MVIEFRFCQLCSNLVGNDIHGHKQWCAKCIPTELTKEIQEANEEVYPEYIDFNKDLLTEA